MKDPSQYFLSFRQFHLCFVLLLLLFLLPGVSSRILAQPATLHMESVDPGVCLSLLQDRQGYIWIGTWKEGLKRYDGHSFRHYRPQTETADSLSGAMIFAIAEAENGDLWIGSDSGLHRFVRNGERFENYGLDLSEINPEARNKGPFKGRAVAGLHLDRAGRLWTGDFGGNIYLWEWENKGGSLHGRAFKPKELNGENFRINVIKNGMLEQGNGALAEDLEGNMWFGLKGDQGLFRYDPSSGEGTRFIHQPDNPNSLPHNTVWEIHVDPNGTLWIGSEGGLCSYHPETGDFTRHPRRKDGHPEEPVYQVAEAGGGKLWLTGPRLIEQFDTLSSDFKEFYYLKDYAPGSQLPPDLTMPSFFYIGKGIDDMEWFNFPGHPIGMFGYDPASDQIRPHHFQDGINPDQQLVTNLMIDHSGLLWMGVISGVGTFRQDPAKSRFKGFRIDRPEQVGLFIETLPFCEDSDGKVWLGGAGLSQYYPEKQSWSERVLMENEIPLDILEDRQGRLWVGTDDGVRRFDPEKRKRFMGNLALGKPVAASSILAWLGHVPPSNAVDGHSNSQWQAAPEDNQWLSVDLEESLSVRSVHLQWPKYRLPEGANFAIQVSEDQTTWQTVYEGYITNELRKEIELKTKGRYLRFLGKKRRQADHVFGIRELEIYGAPPDYKSYRWRGQGEAYDTEFVQDIYEDYKGQIWIAAGKGIGLFREDQDQFEFFQPFPEEETENNWFWQIQEDKNGLFWLTWHNPLNGIYVFDPDPDKRTFTHYQYRENDPFSLASNEIHGIFRDRDGNIWVTADNTVQRFDHEKKHFVTLYTSGFSDPRMYPVYEDSRGWIWVSEYNNGIYAIDPEKGLIKHLRQGEGLKGDSGYFIQEDDRGYLWIVERDCLTRYDLETDRAHHFSEEDGLHFGPNRPLDKAATYVSSFFRDGRGRFYICSQNGFSVFDPLAIELDRTAPQINFTKFRLLGRDLTPNEEQEFIGQPFPTARNISLPYDKNTLSFEFTGLHYSRPEAIRYQVKMNGPATEWNDLGFRNWVDYPGLPPGRYTLQVRAANPDGIWSEPEEMGIVIRPPWWKSPPFYVLYLVLTGGMIYALYQFQLNRRLEKAENFRLQELDQIKTQMYTNISHEFRTPLTVILGMADKMGDDPENWFREGLQLIKRNGQHLLLLVNQLLDLRKYEAGAMKLHLSEGDLIGYLKYLLESFDSLAGDKGQKLHFLPEVQLLNMAFDAEKIQTIFYNLLYNAIKFTPAGGEIYLLARMERSSIREDFQKNRVLIQVHDNGPGIDTDDLPHIFDRFYRAENHTTAAVQGMGIGLALTKQLVELHGGKISVRSTPGKGSTFIIELPVKQINQEPASASVTTDLLKEPISFLPPIHTFDEEVLLSEANERMPAGEEDPRPSILLIEDNPDVVRYLRSCLEADYQISTANDGEMGISHAIDQVPDLIISDIMMPKKDGFEVCTTLKEDFRTSHIPIILLTAKADKPSKFEGLEGGADAYLTKPFDREELLLRVRKLIELRLALHQRYATLALPLPGEEPHLQKEDAFLQQLRQVIEENLDDETFGIPGICKAMGVSRTQLHRKLKALTGKSASHFIRSVRLERARKLLRSTDLTIAEIALEVGISNQSFFSRIFSEYFGKTPTEMRE